MITARQPFQFVTASHLTRVENQKAQTIRELLDCDLGRYHFLTYLTLMLYAGGR